MINLVIGNSGWFINFGSHYVGINLAKFTLNLVKYFDLKLIYFMLQ